MVDDEVMDEVKRLEAEEEAKNKYLADWAAEDEEAARSFPYSEDDDDDEVTR